MQWNIENIVRNTIKHSQTVEFVKLFKSALSCEANRVEEKEEDCLWCTGASHCAYMGKSLHGLWLAAGKMSGGNSLYIPASV